jgi:hypothetical protein
VASKIQVYKAAATAVGSSTQITSPEDDRPVARAITAVWEIQRQAAIRDGSWNFAIKRARLPALNSAPTHGYDYAYQLPAACLRLIEVSGQAREDYQLEGREILCDARGPLDIRYLRDVTEPAEWDSEFADAFAQRIAWRIGRKLAGSTFDKDGAWREYQALIAAAKSTDAIENPPIEQEESDWVKARHAHASWDPARPWG